MDSSDGILTKLLRSFFSQVKNPAFAKRFAICTAIDFIPCPIYPSKNS